MGFDMQAVKDESEAGYFRLNIFDMNHVLNIMNAAGLIDRDTPTPDWPDGCGWMDEEAYDRIADPLRATRSPHPLQIPICKFLTNDGWLVTPEECYIIANRLRSAPDDTAKRFAAYCAACVNKGGFRVY